MDATVSESKVDSENVAATARFTLMLSSLYHMICAYAVDECWLMSLVQCVKGKLSFFFVGRVLSSILMLDFMQFFELSFKDHLLLVILPDL